MLKRLPLQYEIRIIFGSHNNFGVLSVEQFKAISQAYEVLSDAKKRELYDRGGEKAIKEGGIASEMHNPMDIFEMFFGMGPHTRSHRGRPKGRDVAHPMAVNLEDLYNGNVRKLSLQKNIICPHCQGLCMLADVDIIFLPYGFYLSSFFSSPNLSCWRLDVYRTSTHGVALVQI